MNIKVLLKDIGEIEADCILVGLFEGTKKPSDAAGVIDKIMGGVITDLIEKGEIIGELNEINFIHTLGKLTARIIAVVGLGKRGEFTAEKLRNVIGSACRAVEKMNCQSLATMLSVKDSGGLQLEEAAEAIVEGAILGTYRFQKYLTKTSDKKQIRQLTIAHQGKNNIRRLEQACSRGKILAEATNIARDMVNEPANYMKPSDMANMAREIARKYLFDLKVMERKDMEKEGMGAILGVAQGSIQPPKFIVMSYAGNKQSKQTLGFIGKGITFDSGGISLKPSENMQDMKGDMSGAAAVLAALIAIAELKIKANVVAIIAATENLPGGSAVKPGDIVKAMNGKTIEVINTDAEGRLTLADALSFAVKNKFSPLIDVATLTGSCQVALGDIYSGIFTYNDDLAKKVIEAGNKAGECLWQLPMKEEYREQNKSNVADIKNTGGRYGGAITAAMFLSEFVGDVPWVHVDIAGTFMLDKDRGYLVKGATGVMVRTLVNFAQSYVK